MGKALFDCTGKVTLVTGGNGRIGLGFAKGVARMAGDIAIRARDAAKNAAAKAELLAAGAGRVETYQVDVGTEQAILDGYATLLADFGRLDCVFANSSASPRCNSIFDMPTSHWHEFQIVALHGAFFTLREAARHMKDRAQAGDPGGSLVACGSLSMFQGLPGKAEYAASKSAIGQSDDRVCSMSAPAPSPALAGLVRAGDTQTEAIDLGAEPTSLAALKIKRVALEHLLVASGDSNLSETMWLRSELAALDAALEAQGQTVA